MSDPYESGDKLLQSIADCLGVPVEAFHNRTVPDAFANATECLWLWSRFKTDAGRAAALDDLRKALDDEGIIEAAAAGERDT